jgi:hypothetical protein
LVLTDSSTTLDGAWVVYLLNNDTILLKLQNGCQIYLSNTKSEFHPNITFNGADRFEGIWVGQSHWSSDPNQEACCYNIRPIPTAYDAVSKTQSWVNVFPDDPACPEGVRNTFTLLNSSANDAVQLSDTLNLFMVPNGSVVIYAAPPFCNTVWVVKKPTMSTLLCDYV